MVDGAAVTRRFPAAKLRVANRQIFFVLDEDAVEEPTVVLLECTEVIELYSAARVGYIGSTSTRVRSWMLPSGVG